jgi:hypothetical protein
MFPRCKKHLPTDSEQRRLVLEAIVLVHNFCTDYVGYSQIKNVFDPKYVRVENLHDLSYSQAMVLAGLTSRI